MCDVVGIQKTGSVKATGLLKFCGLSLLFKPHAGHEAQA